MHLLCVMKHLLMRTLATWSFWKVDFHKGFSWWTLLGIMKKDQLSSNLDLQLLCTIWNICVYIIFWDIIYSLRKWTVSQFEMAGVISLSFGCLICFGWVLSFFFSLCKEDMCTFGNSTWHCHWKASYKWTPGIWGIVMILNQELPSVSTPWPQEAHHPVLLLSTLCNISMQAWLT